MWKRIKCFLTGGCKYEDINLEFTYMQPRGRRDEYYIIRNHCVKCGKLYKSRIEEKYLREIMEQVIKRWKRRAEDG